MPASRAFAITPNDSADLANNTRGIYVGVTGDLRVILTGDTVAVTFSAVPAGSLLPIRAKRVTNTGTTATGLVGVF